MTTMIFTNRGEIDIQGALIFGANVKESEKPVGFFGTGLKYSLARLLATGHNIEIHSGLTIWTVIGEPITIRGREFTQVVLHNRESNTSIKTGYTTELGKTWDMWQIWRELYCNAHDEPDPNWAKIRDESKIPAPAAGWTHIIIREPDSIDQSNRLSNVSAADVLLPTSKPLAVATYGDDSVEIHDKPEHQPHYLYYRGIRVLELSRETRYNYNIISDLELTEDRSPRHTFMLPTNLGFALSRIEPGPHSDEIITKVILAPDEFFESDFAFAMQRDRESQFYQTVARRLDQGLRVCESAIRAIGVSQSESIIRRHKIEPTQLQQTILAKAEEFLTSIGTGYIPNRYPIHICSKLSDNVLGMADRREEIILLSAIVFDQGTKQVAATLLEEFTHLHHGLPDNCYAMQTHLFNLILSVGETAQGEPL